MKEGTESKIKFKRLQKRLGLTLWQCTGLLESIWRITAQNTPRGDIGVLSNYDIASTIEWSGDADELIAALSDGWLDPCPTHRLVVHDWPDHAPNYIKGNLAKHGKTFVGNPAKQPKTGGDEAADPPKKVATKPSQAKPSQVGPSRAEPGHNRPDETDPTFFSISEEDRQTVQEECKRLQAVCFDPKSSKRPADDKHLVFTVATLKHLDAIPEVAFAKALTATKSKVASGRCNNPPAFFWSRIVLACQDFGIDAHELRSRVVIPEWAREIIESTARPPPGVPA